MKILLLGRLLDLTIALLTAIIVSFFTSLILPETLSFYFFMPMGMILGGIIGIICGFIFSLINILFNLMIHTMIIGMLSGMMAFLPESYMMSICIAFFVWLVLFVSDEYYARIINKVEYEFN